MTERQIQRIVTGSKRYEFNGAVLTVIDYFDSRNRIQLDLSKLTPELLIELRPDEEKLEFFEWLNEVWGISPKEWDDEYTSDNPQAEMIEAEYEAYLEEE